MKQQNLSYAKQLEIAYKNEDKKILETLDSNLREKPHKPETGKTKLPLGREERRGGSKEDCGKV